MHHLFYLMGKSASGKDTLYKLLLERLPLLPLVLCTTRPQRAHEQDGTDYHFIGQAELSALRKDGLLIEERTYHTVMGDWTYCTARNSVPLEQGVCGRMTFEWGEKEVNVRKGKPLAEQMYPWAEIVVLPGVGHCSRLVKEPERWPKI